MVEAPVVEENPPAAKQDEVRREVVKWHAFIRDHGIWLRNNHPDLHPDIVSHLDQVTKHLDLLTGLLDLSNVRPAPPIIPDDAPVANEADNQDVDGTSDMLIDL